MLLGLGRWDGDLVCWCNATLIHCLYSCRTIAVICCLLADVVRDLDTDLLRNISAMLAELEQKQMMQHIASQPTRKPQKRFARDLSRIHQTYNSIYGIP